MLPLQGFRITLDKYNEFLGSAIAERVEYRMFALLFFLSLRRLGCLATF
jgi:hypothetical protein